jgi:hypothetical protein
MPQSETLHQAREWLTMALLTINFIAAIVMVFIGMRRASKDALAAVDERVTVLDKRVTAVELQADGAPGWEVLNDLKEKLGEIDGDVKALTATLRAVHSRQVSDGETMRTLNQFLLERGRTA